MLTLHTFTTPNGRKVSIMLEELGLPYVARAVDITRGEQFAPDFLAISPNNKIPALVDDEADGGPLSVFESGAILVYLAEKTGRFLPRSGPGRVRTLEWLAWQVGGLGPMFGQLGYFGVYAKEKNPAAIERFRAEGDRLLGVLERRLAASPFLAGDEYGIADIASYPWAVNAGGSLKALLGDSLATKPAVRRWLDTVGARPGVQRGMGVPTL